MFVSVCSGEGSQQPGAGGGLAATSQVGSGRPAFSLPSLPPLFPNPGSLLSHPSPGDARAMGTIRRRHVGKARYLCLSVSG